MIGTRVTPEDLLGPLDEVEKKHAPRDLFIAGDRTLVTNGARVSIVGSRKASGAGIQRAQRLASLLAERRVVVVSGLAEGIDAVAHTTAIECGGRTIAVLGTPLDECFPAKHRALQARIMADHLVVSQFAPGQMLGTRAFPMRNRTMALLSDVTVIVEAGAKSGTIHQGWEALRLGRPLFIMESLVREGHEWTSEMQRYGALVLSDRTKDVFLESIPEESRVERIDASF
jgi:DNA processing protein